MGHSELEIISAIHCNQTTETTQGRIAKPSYQRSIRSDFRSKRQNACRASLMHAAVVRVTNDVYKYDLLEAS
jgi:hypothetical protein